VFGVGGFLLRVAEDPNQHRKTPMRIHIRGEEPFVFAGLWDAWKKPDETEIESHTIVTCEPNNLMQPIHNRMPVILKSENYDQWLDPKNEDVEGLAKLLMPYPEKEMATFPVSTLVNNPKFDDPRCVK
jgi:putative SOS response-associated peptidase YedK